MRRAVATAVILIVFAGAWLVARPSGRQSPGRAEAMPEAVPVLAAEAQAKDVQILLRGLGTVTAFNTVDIESRVEGAITAIAFREGQVVKAGDLLIQLDPRPYDAALAQAKATLVHDTAQLANDTEDRHLADAVERRDLLGDVKVGGPAGP